MRFDELELEPEPRFAEPSPHERGFEPLIASEVPHGGTEAPRLKRFFALVTDLSLFAALALALSPLLPLGRDVAALTALGGFVLLVSYYYFVGCWLLWGKTVGGAIFDVRVVSLSGNAMALRTASLRWAGVLLSLLTAGGGFLLALLPSRQSLPDRLSGTWCAAAG